MKSEGLGEFGESASNDAVLRRKPKTRKRQRDPNPNQSTLNERDKFGLS